MFSQAKDNVKEGGDLYANPMHARMMRGMMRNMMNGMMKVTPHNNDCTQKEVADFMNPYSVGKPFEDKPGTFDPGMKPRMTDKMMCGMMVMDRKVMRESGDPHNKGITFEKYKEFRPRTLPGYEEHSPEVDWAQNKEYE